MLMPSTAKRWIRLATRAGMALWVLGLAAIVAMLMVGHVVALPRPDSADGELAAALAALRAQAPPSALGPPAWMAVHVLGAECGCSRRIAEHLLDGARPAGVSEVVLLVGHDEELTAKLQGRMSVVEVTPEELGRRFHIEAAPLLLAVDPAGTVRYSGGYTDRKRGPEIEDVKILADLTQGREVKTIPVFGCAFGESLKKNLDPLGLKGME
jgi:hypothetical protein